MLAFQLCVQRPYVGSLKSATVDVFMMLKTRPVWATAKSNLRDRVFGEVEKNNFIALPGRGGHSRLVLQKLCVPTRADLLRSFIAMVQGWGC